MAMISTNGDEKVSKMISEAVWKSDIITVEKSNSRETYVEVIKI